MDFYIEVPSWVQLNLRIMANAISTNDAIHRLSNDLEANAESAERYLQDKLTGTAVAINCRAAYANPTLYTILVYWDKVRECLKVPLEYIESVIDRLDYRHLDTKPWLIHMGLVLRPAYIMDGDRRISIHSEYIQLPQDGSSGIVYQIQRLGCSWDVMSLQQMVSPVRLDEVVEQAKRSVESGQGQKRLTN